MPEGMLGMMCSAKATSGRGLSSAPSSTMALAPQLLPATGADERPSSEGWKTNLTVPGICSRMPASTSATAISIAVWPSWPQACITGDSTPMFICLTCDAKGSPVTSATGSASMSARSATTLPGRPPWSRPTTPWPPTPVRTSMPSLRRCSATSAAVRSSWPDSSGCWWMSRRHSTMRGWMASKRVASACRVASSSTWAEAAAPWPSRARAAARRSIVNVRLDVFILDSL